MTETREQIATTIARTPGVHFSALVRECSIARGQAQYHLRRLVEDGAVVREDCRGRAHYFPPTIDSAERRRIALLRRETARAIVRELLEAESARPVDLASRLDLPRSTLEYHLETLEDADVVVRQRLGGRVVVTPCDPDALRAALELVDPGPVSSALDRFERLVDRLLAEAE